MLELGVEGQAVEVKEICSGFLDIETRLQVWTKCHLSMCVANHLNTWGISWSCSNFEISSSTLPDGKETRTNQNEGQSCLTRPQESCALLNRLRSLFTITDQWGYPQCFPAGSLAEATPSVWNTLLAMSDSWICWGLDGLNETHIVGCALKQNYPFRLVPLRAQQPISYSNLGHHLQNWRQTCLTMNSQCNMVRGRQQLNCTLFKRPLFV